MFLVNACSDCCIVLKAVFIDFAHSNGKLTLESAVYFIPWKNSSLRLAKQ